jgi:hypothetical protein
MNLAPQGEPGTRYPARSSETVEIRKQGTEGAADMSDEMMRFLDTEGRVRVWPARREMKRRILEYLATKFQAGQMYSEKEVNDVLRKWHTFEDYFLLRRGLVDERLLLRTRNGATYWLPDPYQLKSKDPVDPNTHTCK